ncbi:MAG: YcnI family protein [Acidimicrobiia bacterium]
MRRKENLRRNPVTALAAASVAAVLLTAGPATAHVTANPREAPADNYTKHNFRVGHGCEGSPTTKVSIQIPDGVVSVKPQVTPGWTISTTKGPYAEPVELHGEAITEGVKEVTWTGGPLPDEHMTEFGLSMRMPDKAGETLYFPTVQTCEQGEHRWITIPVEGQEEPEEPAPAVKLIAASDDEEAEAASGEQTCAGRTELGDGELAAASDDGGTDGVAVAALVAGIAGFLMGGGALGIATRRKQTSS